jgi:hypothetical protein
LTQHIGAPNSGALVLKQLIAFAEMGSGKIKEGSFNNFIYSVVLLLSI